MNRRAPHRLRNRIADAPAPAQRAVVALSRPTPIDPALLDQRSPFGLVVDDELLEKLRERLTIEQRGHFLAIDLANLVQHVLEAWGCESTFSTVDNGNGDALAVMVARAPTRLDACRELLAMFPAVKKKVLES